VRFSRGWRLLGHALRLKEIGSAESETFCVSVD
jgi:hypothetical protein